ncbi:MAG: hypothetical protein CBC27_00495 [Opitutia bacterium TMED67]|nr:hypothetical protein [Verrucomicrobiales bacterium]OUU77710.1 MAG: hypothetical protein CBC27_00495 [Opitutae bacterium TMED67]
MFGNGLLTAVPELSSKAIDSLVAHYDGSKGVETVDNAVVSWTPVDSTGQLMDSMIVQSAQKGNGGSDLISYDGTGKLFFDDTSVAADGRYLTGKLSNTETKEFTIFWLGHYKADAPFATSGTYAYNIGLSNTSHQRDDGKGGFVVEQYNGITYSGNDISEYDDQTTVWSTVLTADSHSFYANGKNLNLGGMPTNNIKANADIVIGAYSSSGYDFVGEIEQLIIFSSALNTKDRKLIENHLYGGAFPGDDEKDKKQPEISIKRDSGSTELRLSEGSHLLSSYDLKNWFIIPEASLSLPIEEGKDKAFYQAASEFVEIPSGIVLRTRIASDTWREAEYHLDTGEFFFIGEQSHGFDHYTSHGNDLWWCYMNTTNKGSGLIEYLMEKNINSMFDKSKSVENGWLGYKSDIYSFLRLKPLGSQKTFSNQEKPEIEGNNDTTEAYTKDYKEVDNSEVDFVLYKNEDNGNIYMGIGGPSFKKIVDPLPPGDGSTNRDNGIRGDIAFKALITLSVTHKLELINKFLPRKALYDNRSEPYYYDHPDGL